MININHGDLIMPDIIKGPLWRHSVNSCEGNKYLRERRNVFRLASL